MRGEDKSATYLTDRGEQEHLRCLGSQRHSSPPPDAHAMVASLIRRAYRIVFPVIVGTRQAWPDGLQYLLYRRSPDVPLRRAQSLWITLAGVDMSSSQHRQNILIRAMARGRPTACRRRRVRFSVGGGDLERTSAPTLFKPCNSPSGTSPE
jgi:hypothetical protein